MDTLIDIKRRNAARRVSEDDNMDAILKSYESLTDEARCQLAAIAQTLAKYPGNTRMRVYR